MHTEHSRTEGIRQSNHEKGMETIFMYTRKGKEENRVKHINK